LSFHELIINSSGDIVPNFLILDQITQVFNLNNKKQLESFCKIYESIDNFYQKNKTIQIIILDRSFPSNLSSNFCFVETWEKGDGLIPKSWTNNES